MMYCPSPRPLKREDEELLDGMSVEQLKRLIAVLVNSAEGCLLGADASWPLVRGKCDEECCHSLKATIIKLIEWNCRGVFADEDEDECKQTRRRRSWPGNGPTSPTSPTSPVVVLEDVLNPAVRRFYYDSPPVVHKDQFLDMFQLAKNPQVPLEKPRTPPATSFRLGNTHSLPFSSNLAQKLMLAWEQIPKDSIVRRLDRIERYVNTTASPQGHWPKYDVTYVDKPGWNTGRVYKAASRQHRAKKKAASLRTMVLAKKCKPCFVALWDAKF